MRVLLGLASIAACGGAAPSSQKVVAAPSSPATPAKRMTVVIGEPQSDVLDGTVMPKRADFYAPDCRSELYSAVLQHQARLESCFAATNANAQTPQEVVEVRFHLLATGAVESARGNGTTGAESCIAAVFDKVVVSVPAGSRAVDVTMPVVLNPEPGPLSRPGGFASPTEKDDSPASPPAPVSVRQLLRTGSLNSAVIEDVVHRSTPALDVCREDRDPSKQAAVIVKFNIDLYGRVASIEGLSSTGAETCVAQVITQRSFPKPPDGRVVKVMHFEIVLH
jgi:hypothetical protein